MHMLIKSLQTFYKVAVKILVYNNFPPQVFWQAMAK